MKYPPSKTQPWSHQVQAWDLIQKNDAYYLAHDMGVGKTKTAIDAANGLDAKSIIVICPKKVIPHWSKEFNRHSHKNYKVFLVEKGNSAQKAKYIQEQIKKCQRYNQPYVIVINWDSFWRKPIGPALSKRKKLLEIGQLMSNEWDLLIADEAHRAKSPGGKASWGLKFLAKNCKRKLFLSGTPMPHSPVDIYAQYRALDSSVFGTNFQAFKSRYCIMGGFENRQIVRFVNMEDLHARMYTRMHHVKADDVLDLPDEMDITRTCELNPATMKIYNELETEFIVEVAEGVLTVKNALSKALRLAQITEGILPLDRVNKAKTIDNNKIETSIEIIEDLPPDEPVVVFYRFDPEVKRFEDAIASLNKKSGQHRTVAVISGNRNELEKFESGNANVALVQIQSGSEGLDALKRAKYCIYLSLGFSLGQYLQSRARIRRPGQQASKVFYYHVVAKGTIDEKIIKAMRKKEEIIDYVMRKIKQRELPFKTGTYGRN